MEKIGYYPGCSLKGTSREYGKSTEKLYEVLGIELQEIDDWVCCGSSPGHSSSRFLSDALALENLSLAEKQGIKRLLVPCMECYSRFKFAQHHIALNKNLKGKLEKITGENYHGGVEVVHPLIHLNEISDKISAKIKKKPKDLKAVCYYGCVFTRPQEVMGIENFEDPGNMESLLEASGVKPLRWNCKTRCCGASLSISNTDSALDMSYEVLYNAKTAGANAIVVACPMCHINLDLRQNQIEKRHNVKFGIPLLYITQMIGLILGCSSKDLGLDDHFVETRDVIDMLEGV